MQLETIILAAGNSSRLGHPKQLLKHAGKTLLRRTAENALSVCAKPLVILGNFHEIMAKELADLPVQILLNPHPQKGMGSSIAVGANALQPNTEALLILLCDQPLIEIADLKQSLNEFENHRPDIVISESEGILSPPAVIGANCFKTLRKLSKDNGLRKLIQKSPMKFIVRKRLCRNAFFDVDTEADFVALEKQRPKKI